MRSAHNLSRNSPIPRPSRLAFGVLNLLVVAMESSGGSANYVFPVIIAAVVALLAFQLWALIDVLSWPSATWTVAGQRKARWLLRVWFLGVIGSVWYVRSARVPLRTAYLTIRTAGR